MKWITRVPATLSAAQAALAQAHPQVLVSRKEGYRYHELPSSYGEIEPRWVLIDSEPRQAQARRTVDKPWRKQSDKDTKASKKFCSTTFACVAFFNNRGDHARHSTQTSWSSGPLEREVGSAEHV